MKCSATQIILTIFNIVFISNSRLFGVILKGYVVVVLKPYKLVSKRFISLVTNANLLPKSKPSKYIVEYIFWSS